MNYAELHCLSNFSFLRGASHPAELVEQAAALGYQALAITDECSLAGIVRAWQACKQLKGTENQGLKLICGASFQLQDGIELILLAPNRRAYTELCSIISHGRLHSAKGSYRLHFSDITRYCRECLALWPADISHPDHPQHAALLKRHFDDRLWLAVTLSCQAQQYHDYLKHYELARRHSIPMVGCGRILMHHRQRKPLQDILTAIRLGQPVQQLGRQLEANSEHYLKPLSLLQRHYPQALLEESSRIAQRCHFELDELRYQYPDEVVPKGHNVTEFLRELTLMGARKRWPDGIPESVVDTLERELAIIAELHYEHYFLTVYDIVQFARNQNILCQGRGSAANSAVCYCLMITEVDPSRSQLLFERFISRERDEPPDIDVDFEHERREEVIQYIYRKYGRSHAALAATVITYRRRSAIRDVGRALGLDEQLLNRMSGNMAWWDKQDMLAQSLSESQISLDAPTIQLFIRLTGEIIGFPRHLSQHVGGFVISREPIASLVPQENAAMPERTIIQWDKEDLESLQMMKIDILALGMLSALRKSLALISQRQGKPVGLMDIPGEDNATYEMLCQADSIGVFQVESRAQMTMLPRLQPRRFYDLVIQIAIVRPGPIQGGMVHPFLQRRQGLEPVTYDSPDIENVLQRTLGVPIFQEQVIQLAMVAAGFSGGEADQLRRAMASWGRNGDLETFKEKLITGMLERGHSQTFAERLFSQMKGFGAYGFPESHSASFALLAYSSAWIKRHYPAEFYCGLLNSQPMGFYSPSQLCQDARRHGVELRPPCINHSSWDHLLEDTATDQPALALRLGLRLVKGLSKGDAEQLCQARKKALFYSIADFQQRSGLGRQAREALARADAFNSLSAHRFDTFWQLRVPLHKHSLFENTLSPPAQATLPAPTEKEDIQSDYRYTGLSLRRHPLALVREQQPFCHCRRAEELPHIEDGRFISVAGMVSCRQRPGTASGVLFITLEDESGNSNIVVWPAIQQQFRQAILQGQLLQVKGRLQRSQNEGTAVIHIIAMHITDLSDAIGITNPSHDFH